MLTVVCLACITVSLSTALPLYGQDGGYSGFASYLPLKNHLKDPSSRGSPQSEDSFHASAGSPDIARRPAKKTSYKDEIVPKSYDVLSHRPSYQHGYDSNKVGQEIPSAPYAKATLYGQRHGGYKIADAYQNQHIDFKADKEQDYKEDYLSHPQPYEYGYRLKDEHGNTQHKTESSDGAGKVHGSYGFTDEHGIYRSVQYVADEGGFRASVKTNEPGTDSQDPADVNIESTAQDKY